jgi:molybdate transport system substrate-binding protein
MNRNHFFRTALAFITTGVSAFASLTAHADELHVLSAGAVEPTMKALIVRFEKATGHTVKVDFSSAPQIVQKLSTAQRVDVLIQPEPGLVAELKNGRFDEASLKWVGKVGMGIVVRSTLPHPKVETVEQVEAALRAAERVVYNTASTGVHLQKQFEGLGWSAWIAPKSIRPNRGAEVAERIKSGQGNEIGFGASTEMAEHKGKGLDYLGPAPGALQNFTRYGLVLPKDASAVAKQFYQAITNAQSKQLFVEMGAWVD